MAVDTSTFNTSTRLAPVFFIATKALVDVSSLKNASITVAKVKKGDVTVTPDVYGSPPIVK